MDNYKDAIKLINDLKLTVLSADDHDVRSGDAELPNNPLYNVLYEILFTELVIPILQKVEHQLGDNTVTFDMFIESENKNEIKMMFSDPHIIIGSHMNPDESVELIVKYYKKEYEEEKDLLNKLSKSKQEVL